MLIDQKVTFNIWLILSSRLSFGLAEGDSPEIIEEIDSGTLLFLALLWLLVLCGSEVLFLLCGDMKKDHSSTRCCKLEVISFTVFWNQETLLFANMPQMGHEDTFGACRYCESLTLDLGI